MTQQSIMLEPDWGFDIGIPPKFEIRHMEIRDHNLYILGIAQSAIKVGDRFTSVVRFAPQVNLKDAIGDNLLRVNLKVTAITAYYNRLNRINADMTAALLLTGNAPELLPTLQAQGWHTDGTSSHQWQDEARARETFILTK